RACQCRSWRVGTALPPTGCSAGGGFAPRARCRRWAPARNWWQPPNTEYGALQHQVRELQRLLGKKLENEILRAALDLAQPKKGCCARPRPRWTTRGEGDGRCARRWRAPTW